MKMLSTGVPSTLGNYLKMVNALFGEDSSGAKYLRDKIDEQGEGEEVLADEGQMIYLLYNMPPPPESQ